MKKTENKATSLRDQVYAVISAKLQHGELLPGALIDQKAICQELGISRTPLNNALLKLDAEGIVTIHPRSRVIVNKLDIEDVEYLYSIICSIEILLIKKGHNNYTNQILNSMDELNQKMRQAAHDGDMLEYGRYHYAYHDIFLEMAPNLFAKRILRPIKNRLWDFPKKKFSKNWHIAACDEHQIITDSLRKNLVEEALSCVEKYHWNYEYNRDAIKQAYYW